MACCIKASFVKDSDKLGRADQSLSCVYCHVCVDRLQYSYELNVGHTDGHCIVYYSVSSSEITCGVGAGFTGSAAPSGTATGSISIKQGTPLVKMFLPIPSEEEAHWIADPSQDYARWFPKNGTYCTKCFEKCHNYRFQSAVVSLKGYAAIINSAYELNPASVGNF